MKGKKKTIAYYDTNAQAFYDRTIDADLETCYERFLKYLSPGALILDAGCGVGRDAKFFLSRGYAVTAFDASKAMVEMCTKETGLPAIQLTFEEMAFDQQFDGIWAQASLLHVPYEEKQVIYQKIHRALKPSGIFYASYKYGSEYMATPDRDFWLMDEATIQPYLGELFEVLEMWKEVDTRSKVSPTNSQMWLNFVARKN